MRKPTYLLIFVLMCCNISCDKGFDDLNVNPNEPTTANPDQLFTGAIYVNAGQFSTGVNSEIWSMEVWMQMLADINGVEAGTNYNYNGSWNDALWNEWYTKVLSPCNQIIELTENDPFLVNKNSIARILRAHNFHRITDLWGDIPYFEALSGFNTGNPPILNPAYDSQQSIYLDLLDELETAVNAIDQGKPGYGSADAMYNGDLNKWIKFGNSLRFRMAMRLSEASPAVAQQIISELLMNEADMISSQNDGAYFQFYSGQEHPFYALDISGQGLRNPSNYLLEVLKSNNDPRVSIYAAASPSSEALGTDPYVGVPNNKTSIELNSLGVNAFTTSEVGTYFRDVEIQGTVLSYAEMCFLKSEAALYGWGGSSSAEDYYQEGIRAAMEWIETPAEDIDAYLNENGSFNGTLEEIITQKWISLVYRDGFEAFAEYRRTGFPILTDENNEAIDLSQFPTHRLNGP
ncbi:MAG: SusD/RagB family nutrient-binding outer membrane lipoprotein [Flavobacteriales bacterium]